MVILFAVRRVVAPYKTHRRFAVYFMGGRIRFIVKSYLFFLIYKRSEHWHTG